MARCRICNSILSAPLLELKNVPAAAQKMPSSQEELLKDKGVDLSVCQCLSCGVIQHTAAPVPYFREVIRASGVSEAMAKFRREQFSSWVERYGLKNKKVFEAGCGQGEYLALMNEVCANSSGTEFGEASAAFCRQAGLTVCRTFFETGSEKLPDAPYEGFFILNFLEHIPDIPSFLTGIRSNLSEGAPGIVEVPNFDMILANAQLTEFSTEHIYYFTASTLSSMLATHGFEVVSCKSIWHDYIISAEVVKRSTLDLKDCAAVQRRLKEEINAFVRSCGSVALWGAGHQAQTTLALTGMTPEKICFVADSSPAKQNSFTFATHIPILPPETLARRDIKGVIVACGGYSDEVTEIIRSRFSKIPHLAVLRENKLEIIQ